MSADFKQGTLLTGKVLASLQVSATTATTIYTVPAASATRIASAAITNVSGSSVNITVGIVPSGGSVNGTHEILHLYPLAAGDTISHKDVVSTLDGAVLDTGAFIFVTASTANAVDVVLTGLVSA